MGSTTAAIRAVEQRVRAVARSGVDSGDGMQLTVHRITAEAAAFGNNLATLANFPAEIRAPHGTLAAVASSVMIEQPVPVVGVRHGEPSTRLLVKTGQSGLLQAMFDRDCDRDRDREARVPVVAPCSPTWGVA